jgi:hypothetical protein
VKEEQSEDESESGSSSSDFSEESDDRFKKNHLTIKLT